MSPVNCNHGFMTWCIMKLIHGSECVNMGRGREAEREKNRERQRETERHREIEFNFLYHDLEWWIILQIVQWYKHQCGAGEMNWGMIFFVVNA